MSIVRLTVRFVAEMLVSDVRLLFIVAEIDGGVILAENPPQHGQHRILVAGVRFHLKLKVEMELGGNNGLVLVLVTLIGGFTSSRLSNRSN